MAVATKSGATRRIVEYTTLQDIIRDAEALAAQPVETLGARSLGEILGHLSLAMKYSIDGFPPMGTPLALRLLGPWLKRWILTRPLKPGFKLPDEGDAIIWPTGMTTATGLRHLRHAVFRLELETQRAPHFIFGQLTPDQWDRLHRNHAALHMSFVKPAEGREHR
jgi:hypothetical protein